MDPRLMMAAFGIQDPYAEQNAAIDSANAMRKIQADMTMQDAKRAQGDPLAEIAMARAPYALSPENLTQMQARMAPEMSPQERWMRQAQAMASSPNAAVQKAGLAQIAQAYAKQADLAKPEPVKYSTFGQEAIDMGLKPGTKAFNDHIIRRGQKKDLFEAEGNKTITSAKTYGEWRIPDGKGGMREPTPADGRTINELVDKGATPYSKTQSEKQDTASFAVSELMLNNLETLLNGGQVDLTGFKGVIDTERSKGTFLGASIDTVANMLGMEQTSADAKAQSLMHAVSNQMIAAIRGAAVGPAEQEMFEIQLPMPGQPPEVQKANLALTKRNLKLIRQLKNGELTKEQVMSIVSKSTRPTVPTSPVSASTDFDPNLPPPPGVTFVD